MWRTSNLGHKGTECSFDAIIKKYNLTDPALQRLAPIVRGADTDAKDLTPESRGLEAIAEGFRLVYQNDHELLERESSVYDALYAYCQQTTEQNTSSERRQELAKPSKRPLHGTRSHACHYGTKILMRNG